MISVGEATNPGSSTVRLTVTYWGEFGTLGSTAEKMIVHRLEPTPAAAEFAKTFTVTGVVPDMASSDSQLQEVVGVTGAIVAVQGVGPGQPIVTGCDPVLPHGTLKLSVVGLATNPEHSDAYGNRYIHGLVLDGGVRGGDPNFAGIVALVDVRHADVYCSGRSTRHRCLRPIK